MRKIKNIHKKNEGDSYFQNSVNKIIYLAAVISPVMTLPQVFEVWINKSSEGISIWTWGAYTFVSFVWILYGIVHKEKPILMSQSLLFILELSIVFGIIFHP